MSRVIRSIKKMVRNKSKTIKMKNKKNLREKKQSRQKELMRNKVRMMMRWHISLVLKA